MIKPEEGDWEDAQIIPMSISHDGGFATAVCMAYEPSAGAIFETAEEIVDVLTPKERKGSDTSRPQAPPVQKEEESKSRHVPQAKRKDSKLAP
jgi:hypothetical protein